MIPYLHILIRVEENGSLHALGAFTSKEKQKQYQQATGLPDSRVRLDFYNGPFNDEIQVVYAGHRRWNMDRFQLAGYFRSESEAWTWVTQDGYVSVLRVDTTFEDDKRLEEEALERYARLQKSWRLSSYNDLVAREGKDKTRANITLRFYEDALESFKPKNRRDTRALYAFFVLILLLPPALFFFLGSTPDYGEHVDSVRWLPEGASDISYYRSRQIEVYEFSIAPEGFRRWARDNGMNVRRITGNPVLSRYRAYMPPREADNSIPSPQDRDISLEEFQEWQDNISIRIDQGLIAENEDSGATALYAPEEQTAYYEDLGDFRSTRQQ